MASASQDLPRLAGLGMIECFLRQPIHHDSRPFDSHKGSSGRGLPVALSRNQRAKEPRPLQISSTTTQLAFSPRNVMHLEKRLLVTGGAGFLGSHLCERV